MVRAQSANRAPALLGPPIITWPATMLGRVVRPGTSRHSSATTHTMRVAPKMTSTSPGWLAPATICSQKASIDPPANTVGVPGTVPDALAHPARPPGAAPPPPRARRGPPCPSARLRRDRRRTWPWPVHGRDPGEGVGGHGLAVPVGRGLRGAGRRPRPASAGPGPARPPRGRLAGPGRRGPPPTRRPRRPGRRRRAGPGAAGAPAVHGGDGGHHRGDHHTGGGAVQLGGHRGEGPPRAPTPGPGDIVLQQLGRRGAHRWATRVRATTVPLGVDGHRLDRGGAHVHTDGAVVSGRADSQT